MDLEVGQVFTVVQAFTSPPGVPKSKYIEGGTYRVTEMNKGFVGDRIDAGDAKFGAPERVVGVRLNAPQATVAGQATVK